MTGAAERIKLEKYIESAVIHSPLMNFDIDSHDIEIRVDPLTGKRCVLGLRLMEKYETLIAATDEEFLNNFVSDSSTKCFFCPEKVRSATPKFSKDILPEGRISIGESILFPNLFPLSKYHALVVPTEKHFLRPNEFTPPILRDAFLAIQKFIANLPSDESLFGSVNSNYMPPAGASAVHPHFQVIVSSHPMNHARMVQMATTEYMKNHGHDYWDDLIELEIEQEERYIGKTGSIQWLTPFSPTSTNEVIGILPIGKFKDFSSEIINNLAKGMSYVVGYVGDE
ncbi:MAG: hypothetical protein ACTSWA_05050, partial [Candidatus Thorarchaeota archaeon]